MAVVTSSLPRDDAVAALLGASVVAGVYLDGWAHLNLVTLESFFTPWHAVLYGAFGLASAWTVAVVGLRGRRQQPWRSRIPRGYGWGLVGVVVFAVGGVLDMVWHLLFGVETGIDALVSPTHLLLLVGGILLISSPVRSALVSLRPRYGPGLAALAASAALAGFFLSYVSAFVDPGARQVFVPLPEGAPGHQAAELAAAAGLGGYLISTVLIVAPVLFLRRRGLLRRGSIVILVAAVALPATVLTQGAYALATVGAIAGAAVAEVVRPRLGSAWLAAVVAALVWTGQLLGLAAQGDLRWPPSLAVGAVILGSLFGWSVAWLTRPGLPVMARVPDPSPPPDAGALRLVGHDPDAADAAIDRRPRRRSSASTWRG
jgi:hypothetical protein